MKIINTEGMAFIGPGSEWFWTALSGIILAVTFIAIYRQLRLQASASAIGLLDAFKREWESERHLRSRLDVLVALRDGRKPNEIPEGAAARLSNYWEQIGTLVKGGHLDGSLIWANHGNLCRTWWALLEPWIQHVRTEDQDPTILEAFEWLAGAMADMDRRAGSTLSYGHDEARVVASRARSIAALQHAIGLEQALRMVIVQSPSASQPRRRPPHQAAPES